MDPAVFRFIHLKSVITLVDPTLAGEQLQQMAADPLMTIAAHSVTHPPDLRALSEEKLQMEVRESKRLLEAKLGIPIYYFTSSRKA